MAQCPPTIAGAYARVRTHAPTHMCMSVRMCMRAFAHACACARAFGVRACVLACVCAYARARTYVLVCMLPERNHCWTFATGCFYLRRAGPQDRKTSVPNWPQDSPKIPQSWPHGGPKMAPAWPEEGPRSPCMALRWPQDGPRMALR